MKWAVEVARTGVEEGLITNMPGYSHLLCRMEEYRESLTKVANYGFVPIPLVYSQVVHLAVYIYFGICLFGEQWLVTDPIDLYYPIVLTFKGLYAARAV